MPTLYDRNALALKGLTRETRSPCTICGLEFDWSAPARSRWSFSADHVIPKSLGGSDELWNLRPAHYGCNSARGNGTTRGLGSRNGLRGARSSTRSPAESRHSERWP